MSVKLVSINIEGHKHLEDKVLPFIKRHDPDVITLQEVFAADVKRIKEQTGMKGNFVPMAYFKQGDAGVMENSLWGLLILSKLPILDSGHEVYFKYQDEDNIPTFVSSDFPEQMNRAVLWIKVLDGKDELTFATTHFTWSKKGFLTPLQEKSYGALENILDSLPIAVLSGDFNAPRGREIFTKLAKRYKDNIPQDVGTTIDNVFHKAPEEINLVVDGLFSAKGFLVSQVKVVAGVSDHKAIVGTIIKHKEK